MDITINDISQIDLRGKVIIFPTDTVYGIGCLYDDLVAIDRIYHLKSRDYTKPMAILGADFSSLMPLVEVNEEFMELAKKHWPGALTLVVHKTELVSNLATSSKDTVGVRVPNHEIALGLLRRFGPMVVTSLNQSGETPIVKFEDAKLYEKKVDYLIDGGDLDGVASTVYDITSKTVLRQGSLVID